MYFPFFIARRYLFSKKSQNVINIISGISVFGVAIGTMALIVILSVFNGLDSLIKSMLNSFDSELKISLNEGKFYEPDSLKISALKQMKGVAYVTQVIEDQALLQYGDRQIIGIVKGVDSVFAKATRIDTTVIDGTFMLKSGTGNHAVIGNGVAYFLSVGINLLHPLQIYVPRRHANINSVVDDAFNKQYIEPAGIFNVSNEISDKYVLVPIDFARNLFEYDKEVSALEIRFAAKLSDHQKMKIQDRVKTLFGPKFKVENRIEQHELMNKIMRSEKWATFLILSFILIIASFNIVGSLTMLILDKTKDIGTLRSMGASNQTVKQIFFVEGWLISLLGAGIGLVIGVLLCLAQMKFGLIRFPNSTIISSYPVVMRWTDFLAVFAVVAIIGLFTAWYPVRNFARRYLV